MHDNIVHHLCVAPCIEGRGVHMYACPAIVMILDRHQSTASISIWQQEQALVHAITNQLQQLPFVVAG